MSAAVSGRMRDVAMVLRRPGPAAMPMTADGIDRMATEVERMEARVRALPDRVTLIARVRAEVASYDAYPKGSDDEPLFTEESDMPERIVDAVLALFGQEH